jgi:hypothetical protein
MGYVLVGPFVLSLLALHRRSTAVSTTRESLLQGDLLAEGQREQLLRVAGERNWGLSLLLVGWLHLLAFSFCYYLTIALDYHHPEGYLAVWVGELFGMWAVFRICGGRRPADPPPLPLELLIRRVWIAYFLLAFNLGSMNTLRGHVLFEFFPATATLASFAFIVLTVVVSRRFFGAVLVMFASGLLMAAHLLHAYLIFALAWWLVLNGIGASLLWQRRRGKQPCGRAWNRLRTVGAGGEGEAPAEPLSQGGSAGASPSRPAAPEYNAL